MSTKICRCCKKEKPIEEFVKDNRSKDGYSTQCKECKKIESNERYNRLKNDPEFRKKHNESNRKSKLKNKEHIDEYNAEYRMRPEVIERMRNYHQERNKKSDLITRYRDIVHRCQARAREKGIPCTIKWTDIQAIYIDTCPLLEIPINWDRTSGRDNGTPSIDRVIPEKGYVPGNIRIISNLANMMKSSASKEQLYTFAKNIKKYMEGEEIVQTIENDESIEE